MALALSLPAAGATPLDQLEAQAGVYSSALISPLQDLGSAYQRDNRHHAAIGALRRAMHLTRINKGLYSEDQLPLLEKLIASQVAVGQIAAADVSHDYLYRVQRQLYSPGSPAISEAATTYGEWKRRAFLHGFGDGTYRHLLRMHTVHSEILEELQANDRGSLAEIPHLYGRLRAEYLISRYDLEQGPVFNLSTSADGSGNALPMSNQEALQFYRLHKNSYRNGRRTIARLLAVLEHQDPVDVTALIAAKIAQGDWFTWWGQRALALKSYTAAYTLAASDGSPSTDPALLFGQPVELPAEPIFKPGVMTPMAGNRVRAVVRFDVSEFGEARNIQRLELEAEREDEAHIALHRKLRSLRFRPILRDGKAIQAAGIEREYTFHY